MFLELQQEALGKRKVIMEARSIPSIAKTFVLSKIKNSGLVCDGTKAKDHACHNSNVRKQNMIFGMVEAGS